MPSLALPEGAKSLCWQCYYWDWGISFVALSSANWDNYCNHPCEYTATDDKVECLGFKKEL